MYTDYTQVSIYTLLFPTRHSTSLDCWNTVKVEGARKAPLKPHEHWTGRTAISWSVLRSLWLCYFYSHILWQHKKRDELQLQVLSMPIQLSGELLEQFKALFPVLPAHGTPPCRTQHFKRQPGWAKVCSWRTWNEQFKTNSFRMSRSKFIHTSQAHQLKRKTFMYM